MWEQYQLLLNAMEDGEVKTNLLNGFTKLQNDNKDTITARDKAKADNAPLKEALASLGEATGLGDNITADAVKELLKSKSKGGEEVDSLNSQLEELRGKYQGLETTHNTFMAESESKAFELALSQSDILANVSSDPFLRNAVISAIKPKLVRGEDGKMYARGDDGKVMSDIVTGKPMSGSELFNNMVDSGQISKTAILPTSGAGTDGQPNRNGDLSSKHIESMNSTELMKQGRK